MVLHHIITSGLMQLDSLIIQVLAGVAHVAHTKQQNFHLMYLAITTVNQELHRTHLVAHITCLTHSGMGQFALIITTCLTHSAWVGSGLSNSNNNCCSEELQPWFYHHLGSSTTDNIEARICISWATYSAGANVVDQLELYIRTIDQLNM